MPAARRWPRSSTTRCRCSTTAGSRAASASWRSSSARAPRSTWRTRSLPGCRSAGAGAPEPDARRSCGRSDRGRSRHRTSVHRAPLSPDSPARDVVHAAITSSVLRLARPRSRRAPRRRSRAGAPGPRGHPTAAFGPADLPVAAGAAVGRGTAGGACVARQPSSARCATPRCSSSSSGRRSRRLTDADRPVGEHLARPTGAPLGGRRASSCSTAMRSPRYARLLDRLVDATAVAGAAPGGRRARARHPAAARPGSVAPAPRGRRGSPGRAPRRAAARGADPGQALPVRGRGGRTGARRAGASGSRRRVAALQDVLGRPPGRRDRGRRRLRDVAGTRRDRRRGLRRGRARRAWSATSSTRLAKRGPRRGRAARQPSRSGRPLSPNEVRAAGGVGVATR